MDLYTLRQQPHLSISGILEYVECGLLYKFGRIDKLPMEFKSDNLEFGTVIHRVLAEFYQARMTGDRMPLSFVQKLFEENWRSVAEGNDEIRYAIPYNYLRKCPPEIQSVQMNYWIEHEKNEHLFARFDGNSVRAIFTPKYKPVDNIDVILEIYGMGYRPETQVQCHLDEEFMSLSIMDGEKVFEINGDRFRPGVSISNS